MHAASLNTRQPARCFIKLAASVNVVTMHASVTPFPQVWRAGSSVLMVRAPAAKATFVLRTLQPADAAALQRLHDDIARSSSGSSADGTARPQDAQQPAAGEQRQRQGGGSHFDQKTEKGSADLYFHYYGEFASPSR